MRFPSVERDGWCLDDAEERHSQYPDTFWIPSHEARRGLYPGCGVKLMFYIESPDGGGVERMWVVVTERLGNGDAYLGVLDNTPLAEEAHGKLGAGYEIPFEPRHVIDIDGPNDATMAIAKTEPARRWS